MKYCSEPHIHGFGPQNSLQYKNYGIIVDILVLPELDLTNLSEKTKKIEKKISSFLTSLWTLPPRPHILTQGRHLKNCLDDPKTTPLRNKHAKFQASIMSVGAVGGGGELKNWAVTFSIWKILVVLTTLLPAVANGSKRSDSAFG